MARDRAARPEAKPLRLFVAAEIPSRVRGALEGAIAPLRTDFSRARWVPPENWHITLKFLGWTWPRMIDWAGNSVERVAAKHTAFETSLSGAGGFPSERRAMVMWAGLADAAGALAAIAADLDATMGEVFKPEKRGFDPHLTLARFDPPVSLGKALEKIEVPPIGFSVDRLVLYRSELRRPAPFYEALRTAELAGA